MFCRRYEALQVAVKALEQVDTHQHAQSIAKVALARLEAFQAIRVIQAILDQEGCEPRSVSDGRSLDYVHRTGCLRLTDCIGCLS
jgi:hypothetical protein